MQKKRRLVLTFRFFTCQATEDKRRRTKQLVTEIASVLLRRSAKKRIRDAQECPKVDIFRTRLGTKKYAAQRRLSLLSVT